ncbi:MAG TPA: shikimate kinase [Acidimicrobiales bacterium]
MTGGRHVILVGMMASGKSAVGPIVAERLGRPFVDSDDQVEARTGRTVREIFESDGEAAYRVLEAEALREAVERAEPVVVAAAGGTVLDPGNRELMRSAGTVVWLYADPEVLAGRVSGGDHRPLLGDDPAAALRRLHDERLPLYRDVADHVVDADDRSAEDVAEQVLGLLA